MKRSIPVLAFIAILFSCNNDKQVVTASVTSLNLTRGDVINCGPGKDLLLGDVSFGAAIPEKLQDDFNTAVALLHSFEYVESEKMFAKVIDGCSDCPMAYWGVAMSNFHPLWAPPTPAELEKGKKAAEIAKSFEKKTKRESDYIDAISQFYENSDKDDHKTRVKRYEAAMEKIYNAYPDDAEALIFYALALNASADPTDKTYTNQKKAISLLVPFYEKHPQHPGIAHYIIHNSDYPPLAETALAAARNYASIAPASPHAQHMPSHIFTRLGLWDESIKSNEASKNSAKCYAEQRNMKGHWDQEIHAMDYLMYAHLQKGDDAHAKEILDYLSTFKEIEPVSFIVAYSYASIPARWALERKDWNAAANLQAHGENFPWEKFPWQKGIVHFTRVLGAVNTGKLDQANADLSELKKLHETLKAQKEKAKEAYQVEVQVKAAEAWINFKQGNNAKALELMTSSADQEDATEKHPVTPGEVVPARELLGEMLLQMKKPAEALAAFELSLKNHNNRYHSLYGAATAAKLSGNKAKSDEYMATLNKMTVGSKRLMAAL